MTPLRTVMTRLPHYSHDIVTLLPHLQLSRSHDSRIQRSLLFIQDACAH